MENKLCNHKKELKTKILVIEKKEVAFNEVKNSLK